MPIKLTPTFSDTIPPLSDEAPVKRLSRADQFREMAAAKRNKSPEEGKDEKEFERERTRAPLRKLDFDRDR